MTNLIKNINIYTLNSLPRGKDNLHRIGNFCEVPFKSLSIDINGDCFICRCDAHLPVNIGKISDFENLEDIWTSNIARDIQQTIIDRTFTYCAVENCGIENQNLLCDEYYISINIDDSCNLACPSCRRTLINHTSGKIYEQKLGLVNHLVRLLNKFNKPVHIVMSGNGDVLASSIMRPLLLNWNPTPDQKITLFTNGLLIKKLLAESKIFSHIKQFQISVDAGSKEVYENVRRPGKFETLKENLEWLSSIIDSDVQVELMFVVSKNNALDIVNYANLCTQLNFSGYITKLANWYTFDNFSEQAVLDNAKHPLYNLTIKQLQTVVNYKNIKINPLISKLL